MLRTFVVTVPVALGAAVSPVLLVALVGMLASGRRAAAWAFALGAAATTAAVTLAAWLVFRHQTVGVASGAHPHRAATVDLVAGGLLLLWGILRTRRWGRPSTPKPAAAGPGTAAALGAGVVLMLTNLSTVALIGVETKLVAHATIPVGEQLVVLALDSVIVLTLVWLPLVLTVAAPRASGAVLASIRGYLDHHGPHALTVVLLLIGPYLIAHGILRW